MTLDRERVDHIVAALATLLEHRSIGLRLEELKRFIVDPEQVDELVLAAIQRSLSLEDEPLAAATAALGRV